VTAAASPEDARPAVGHSDARQFSDESYYLLGTLDPCALPVFAATYEESTDQQAAEWVEETTFAFDVK
jgi:hypothetical protein